MSEDNTIVVKSKVFALRIIKAYQYLVKEKKEYVLSRQMLRSGTSIGANVKEAIRAQSKPDFIAKMSIALKEASETEYWIELLQDSGYLSPKSASSLHTDCVELLKILTAIIKTTKENT